MRTLKLNKLETLCVPDEGVNLDCMATYDSTGWVQIGRMGSAASLLIDQSEWSDFVQFVSQFDTHMAVDQVGVYRVQTVDE
jgi:hypothetical protein